MENRKLNREWVKSAAIIFLLILLLLTFFSNTISNRLLPEVSTSAAQSGTITAKIRCTGTVSSIGKTEIKAPGTTTVASVKAKEGAEVNEGDVLFVMAETSEELEAALSELESLQYDLMRAQASSSTAPSEASINSAATALSDAQYDYNKALEEYNAHYTNPEALEAAKTAADTAYSNYEAVKTEQEKVKEEAYAQYLKDLEAKLENALEIYSAKVSHADELISQALESYNTLKSKYDAMLNDNSLYSDSLQAAKTALEQAENALAAAEETYANTSSSNGQTSYSNYINVLQLQSKIKKAEEKVANLQGGEENAITAPISGTVTSISASPGSKVAKDDVLCIIEVPDLGYSMSSSVTNDQAKRLKVGDTATVQNFYWGSQISAEITSIKVDPKDPQNKKLVTFTIEGDVSAGSELTISVGEKSASYELVIPKSALRQDSNGYFVLLVTSKNNALGNRYFVSRVPVEVLASDDNYHAVSGNLSNGDFVVTTSSAPLSSGDQVALAAAG